MAAQPQTGLQHQADGSIPSGVWIWETELVVGNPELTNHDFVITELRRW